jgi:D-3-phosphoglycerate dehydrogenase
VIFYDVTDRLAHGNARRMGSLEDLLAEADVVSLHVDGRPGNAGFFGAEHFDAMKPRSLFINAARGMVVDNDALRERVLSGHIAGAALDVFPIEPKAQGDPFESPLRGLDNVILTPHVGGSTQEAQEEIGQFVADKLVTYVEDGSTALSVNLPTVQATPRPSDVFRLALLHDSVPGVLAQVNQVLAEEEANILAQSLATRGEQGYVVTDVSEPLDATALERLRSMPHTLLMRALPA